MRWMMQLRPKIFVLGLVPSVLALLVVPVVLGGKNLLAQTYDSQTTKSVQQTAATRSRRGEEALTKITAPQAPASSASQSPDPAKVSWDGRSLEIEASNSSLNQILHQVAAATGARLQGLTQDQRVFGRYGPGPGRDVLWKLLDGS